MVQRRKHDSGQEATTKGQAMRIIMFTHDNALRFWSHGKETTIRAAGKSGKPRHTARRFCLVRGVAQ